MKEWQTDALSVCDFLQLPEDRRSDQIFWKVVRMKKIYTEVEKTKKQGYGENTSSIDGGMRSFN